MTQNAEQNIDEMISTAVAKYNVTDAYLAEAKERSFKIVVKDHTDVETAELAKVVHAEVRDTRLVVEHTRKDLKEDALRYGQAVDREAKRIRDTLEECETHLKSQIEVVTKYQERVEKERIEKAIRELEEREAAERAAKEKAEAEAREKRRQEELEAARKEAAEKARKEAEEKAEREKAEAEKRAEREKAEAEERIKRAEQEAENAKKAAAETEERMKREAEETAVRVKKEAEDAAVREKEAQERRAAEEAAAEADRRASAPNREKLLRYADDLMAVDVPPVTGKYAKTMDAALGLVSDAVGMLREGAK